MVLYSRMLEVIDAVDEALSASRVESASSSSWPYIPSFESVITPESLPKTPLTCAACSQCWAGRMPVVPAGDVEVPGCVGSSSSHIVTSGASMGT